MSLTLGAWASGRLQAVIRYIDSIDIRSDWAYLEGRGGATETLTARAEWEHYLDAGDRIRGRALQRTGTSRAVVGSSGTFLALEYLGRRP